MSEQKKESRKRNTSVKHRLILDTAIQVFIKSGYDGTSMDLIAAAGGVSKRTLYNHFGSKENLFQEVIAVFIQERDMRKPLEYSTARTLEEQLTEFAQAELYLIDDVTRRGLSRLLTSVFLTHADLGMLTRGKYKPHEAMIAWLGRAGAEGRLQFDSAELTAGMFYGLVEGCLTWPALMTDGASLQFSGPVLKEIISVFLEAYRAKTKTE